MQIRPLVLGVLFLVLLYVLFSPPGSGGGAKHDDHKDKDKHKKH